MVKRQKIDEVDRQILLLMLNEKTSSLTKIGLMAHLSKSAVEKRVKRLMKEGILKGFIPQLDKESIPDTITAFSLIRAKYGPKYSEKVGRELAKVEGVCGVYFILGDNDFIVILKARNSKELNEIINKFALIENVERSSTIMALSTEFEDISKFFPLRGV